MATNQKKPYINTLMNINNIFGIHEGRVMPIIITLLIAAIPLFVWLLFLQNTIIKFWMALVFAILLGGRAGLIFIGKEKEKMQFYIDRRNGKYLASKDILEVTYIQNDGLIEYTNGDRAYLVYGYLKGYLDDDNLSIDMEDFMTELDNFRWDMSLYNMTDEILCTAELPLLKRYADKQVIQDRVDFYKYQDAWMSTHTQLYMVVFIVKGNKNNWKYMRSKLEEILSSDIAGVFNEIGIANYAEVQQLMSRDVTIRVDLNEQLVNKFRTDEPEGARILYYDDDVVEGYEEDKRQGADLNRRRVTFNTK